MKKYTIILIISIAFIIVGVLLVKIEPQNKYDKIINRIDNKETFNLLILKDYNLNIKKNLEYYEEAYHIDCEYLLIDRNFDKLSNKLTTMFNFMMSDQDESAFIAIKDGQVEGFLIGTFYETDLKDTLISSKAIDKKYSEIDYVISDNTFENFYNKNDLYNILYINADNKELYEYRNLLVKNNVKSLIIYESNLASINTNLLISNGLGSAVEPSDKLPMLIKMKSGKIMSHYSNISLNDFSKKLK